MSEPTMEEVAAMRVAADLAPVLPVIEDQIKRMADTTISDAMKAIREGSLTPERAVSLWMEMHSYQRLSKRLIEKAAYRAN